MENVELTVDDVELLNEAGPWVALNVKISKLGVAYTISGGDSVSFRSQ